jgi:hypothetical protein
MQANLLAPCPDLEAVEVTDMGDLLQACVDTNAQYRLCAARHNALAKAVGK